jgi:protein-S-isoprenylcysteine O-methyltransferase Ste14
VNFVKILLGKPWFVLLAESTLAALAFVGADTTRASLWLGLFIVSVGTSLYTWAAFYYMGSRKAGFGFGGPYRIVRYPILLSRFLILLGLLIATRSPWLFLLAVALLAPFYRQLARIEDQKVQEALGPLAIEYRASVSGFIPQLLPVRMMGLGSQRRPVNLSWKMILWESPLKAGSLWAVLAIIFIWQYILTERFVLDWQWRLIATGIILATSTLIYKYAHQLGLRLS